MSEETSNQVNCHFWDPQSGAGKNPNSKCEGQAKKFVRIGHTKRLCPLCDPCHDTFVRAAKDMQDEVKKSIPGSGEYEEVSLEDGREEFARQPPKKAGPS